MDPAFPDDVLQGKPNSLAAYNALVDLFTRITI
jgi:hypothetical protein